MAEIAKALELYILSTAMTANDHGAVINGKTPALVEKGSTPWEQGSVLLTLCPTVGKTPACFFNKKILPQYGGSYFIPDSSSDG